jgi:serine/threonine-protein kinase RsbW
MAVGKTFTGEKQTVAAVRSWVAGLVADTGRVDDVVLAASELATNAVLHTMSGAPTCTFTVRVAIDNGRVYLTVIDLGPALIPEQRPDGESGRGLPLVYGVADEIDVQGGSAITCVFYCEGAER